MDISNKQSNGWLIGVLAGGKSTRMNSSVPKVLHTIAGKAMVKYVLESIRNATEANISVVVPPNAKEIRNQLADNVSFVEQPMPLGTGDAVRQLQTLSETDASSILIAYGDTPLIKPETISKLIAKHESSNATLTLLTSVSDAPNGYGRIIRNATGNIVKLTEQSALEETQLRNNEVNAGLYAFDNKWLWKALEELEPSPNGEYYLTDLVEKAATSELLIESVATENGVEGIGINDRKDLAKVEQVIRRYILDDWMAKGVTIIDPSATYIDAEVTIGKDTTIHPNTSILGQSMVGERCTLGPNTVIRNSTIGDSVGVVASIIERAILKSEVAVGPFSHIRPDTVIEAKSNIGNFAEIKNSRVGENTSIGHFGYVGDSTVGNDVNIGAGTITSNFDGETKYRTNIEDGAFIGSDTILIAPVKVGKRSYTAAGAVITKDVPDDNLAIGVPAEMKARTRKSEKTVNEEPKKSELGEAELG